MNAYKLIIFDADGTLTPLRGSAVGPFSFTLLPGVAEKCAELRTAGVLLAIASNQSARRPIQDIINQAAWTREKTGALYFDFQTNPDYQKPYPYMLLGFMDWFAANPGDTLFVGDQYTDAQAAQAAGVDFMWASQFFGGGQ